MVEIAKISQMWKYWYHCFLNRTS